MNIDQLIEIIEDILNKHPEYRPFSLGIVADIYKDACQRKFYTKKEIKKKFEEEYKLIPK